METQGRKAALLLQLNNFSIPCHSPARRFQRREAGAGSEQGSGRGMDLG